MLLQLPIQPKTAPVTRLSVISEAEYALAFQNLGHSGQSLYLRFCFFSTLLVPPGQVWKSAVAVDRRNQQFVSTHDSGACACQASALSMLTTASPARSAPLASRSARYAASFARARASSRTLATLLPAPVVRHNSARRLQMATQRSRSSCTGFFISLDLLFHLRHPAASCSVERLRGNRAPGATVPADPQHAHDDTPAPPCCSTGRCPQRSQTVEPEGSAVPAARFVPRRRSRRAPMLDGN